MGLDSATVINQDKDASDFINLWHSGASYIEAHTSGSTGTPKRILLNRHDMLLSARLTNNFFSIDNNSILRCPLSCQYIAGKMMIVRAEVARCTVDFTRDLSLKSDVTLMSVVPAQLETLLTVNPGLSRRLDNLLIGGAPLPQLLEKQLVNIGVRAWVSYGMTETCSHVALRRTGSSHYCALDGITFETDQDNRLIINAPAFTFSRIITNDVVTLNSSTSFIWIGRYDNIINTGAVKVNPEFIEQKISHLIPPGTEFYVTWRPHPRWGQEIVLVCDRDPGLSHLNLSFLPSPQRPHAIIIRPVLHTPNGKVLRQPLL